MRSLAGSGVCCVDGHGVAMFHLPEKQGSQLRELATIFNVAASSYLNTLKNAIVWHNTKGFLRRSSVSGSFTDGESHFPMQLHWFRSINVSDICTLEMNICLSTIDPHINLSFYILPYPIKIPLPLLPITKSIVGFGCFVFVFISRVDSPRH